MYHMSLRGGCALVMEQRTGKTRVAFEVMARLSAAGLVRRALVIAPRIPCSEWTQQAGYLPPGYDIALLSSGSKKQRVDALRSLSGPLQIAVVNYDSAWRLSELAGWADLIVADEMQKVKSHNSKRTKGVTALGHAARFRLGLSGTPVTNGPMDVYSEWKYLDESIFGPSFFSFRGRYAVMSDGYGAAGKFKQVVGYRRLDELTEKAHSIAYRVTMAECSELPEVEDVMVDVPLSDEAERVYRALERDSVAAFEAGETSVTSQLTKMMRLQQVTCGFVPRDDGEMV
jgi:hypothetical protein